jgi:hypothetical protein
MVAKVVNIDDELIGLHRTFLRPDGSVKADIELQKAMLGRVADAPYAGAGNWPAGASHRRRRAGRPPR